jgi:phage terminase large subunit-like protein
LLRALTAEKTRRLTENRLAYYRPYPKQIEFHDAGATARERLLMAGNQLGKTLAGANEAAMHATGRYPTWWKGRRFDRPVVGWVCGVTGEVVRDTVQRVLVGRPGQEGTGAIPKDALRECVSARGTPDLLDTIKVEHVCGGQSIIGLKTYASGREKFQGETLDFVWFDEEPPFDIYTEGLTRTNVGASPVWMTFTPLLGVSSVVKRFLHEKSDDRHKVVMTIDDVDHYSDDDKKTIIASYPAHELEARTKGIPVLGSGRIFPVPEEIIVIDHRDFPPHGQELAGWTLAGITHSLPWSWYGIAMLTLFMSAGPIA